jgi:hypothetical protein
LTERSPNTIQGNPVGQLISPTERPIPAYPGLVNRALWPLFGQLSICLSLLFEISPHFGIDLESSHIFKPNCIL